MADEIVIERRFRGPEHSANGGYACAMVAQALEPDPAIEVTLRAPPPLDVPLSLETANGEASLRDGDTLIASGRPAGKPQEPPAPVSLEQAEEAMRSSHLHGAHPFPMCFVCGTERADGDGLRVILGAVGDQPIVAAPYEARPEDADAEGRIRDEVVWSVLDCPSGVAGMHLPGLGVCVLGRLTALLEQPLEAGRKLVAMGWPISRDGRKVETGSAIFTPEGERLAYAQATWIELREQPG